MISCCLSFFRCGKLHMLNSVCPKRTSASAGAKVSVSHAVWLKICSGVNEHKQRKGGWSSIMKHYSMLLSEAEKKGFKGGDLSFHGGNFNFNLCSLCSFSRWKNEVSTASHKQCQETRSGQMLLQQSKPAQWVNWHCMWVSDEEMFLFSLLIFSKDAEFFLPFVFFSWSAEFPEFQAACRSWRPEIPITLLWMSAIMQRDRDWRSLNASYRITQDQIAPSLLYHMMLTVKNTCCASHDACS